MMKSPPESCYGEGHSISALVNKLVPCAWLSSGALEVWRLRLRLYSRTRVDTLNSESQIRCSLSVSARRLQQATSSRAWSGRSAREGGRDGGVEEERRTVGRSMTTPRTAGAGAKGPTEVVGCTSRGGCWQFNPKCCFIVKGRTTFPS